MESGMLSTKLTIDSPLSKIADDIANKYLLRPFPQQTLPSGLLDYTSIRSQPIDKTILHRPIHGYQNACNTAGLVEILSQIYLIHADEFSSAFKLKLKDLSSDYIKKTQITGLLRSTGRTQDGDHGIVFAQQAKLECLHYLKELDMDDENEREHFANALVESVEDISAMSMARCLLLDISKIETLRDTVAYSEKNVLMKDFIFYNQLTNKNSIIVYKFIDLCRQHANNIKQHQGFLLHAIKDESGKPIVENWPILDSASYVSSSKEILKKYQAKLEYNHCFEDCFFDLNEILKSVDKLPYTINTIIHEFITDNNISDFMDTTNPKQYEKFIAWFRPKLGTPVIDKNDKTQQYFHLNWENILNFIQNNYPNKLNHTITTSLKALKKNLQADNIANTKKILLAFPELIHLPLMVDEASWETIIFYAIRQNKIELLKILIDISANQIHSINPILNNISPLHFSCQMENTSPNITEFLIQNGADVNHVKSDGVPLFSTAARIGNIKKLCALLGTNKVAINATSPKGNTALMFAINNNQVAVVRLLLSLKNLDINHKNANGVSALSLAATNGYISIVELLLTMPRIDYQGVAQIAYDNNHDDIGNLIESIDGIPNLEKNINADEAKHRFQIYCENLRKTPTRDLYYSFLKQHIALNKKFSHTLTPVENEYTDARRIWSDVVSETTERNAITSHNNNVNDQVIARIAKLLPPCPITASDMYEAIIHYLRYGTTIFVTFNAGFLNNGLNDLQLLNIWEKNNRKHRPDYLPKRVLTETELFKHLNKNLNNQFTTNIHSRPRYAVLYLLENDHEFKPIPYYGKSWIAFKDFVKLNALFYPKDSLDHFVEANNVYDLCSVHHLELLLLNCDDDKLSPLIKRIVTGTLPESFNQNEIYIEALLPPLTITNDMLEMIYIDPDEYCIEKSDLAIMQNKGLPLFNTPDFYKNIKEGFFTSIKNDDAYNVEKLLKQHPSLNKITSENGLYPIHLAEMHACNNVQTLLSQNKSFIIPSKEHINIIHNKTEFYSAIRLGQVEIVEHYLKNGINIYSLDYYTNSALHIAVYYSQINIVKLFLTFKPDLVFSKNNEGVTPLIYSLLKKIDRNIALLLLENGATVNDITTFGNTALLHALKPYKDDKELLLALINTYHADVNLPTSRGHTPLMIAIFENFDPDIIKAILLKTKDINATVSTGVEKGATALHLAVYVNNLYAVEELLTHGADINLKSAEGFNPVQMTNREITKTYTADKRLIYNTTDSKIIFCFLKYLVLNDDIINLGFLNLCVPDIDLNYIDDNQMSLLHYAVSLKANANEIVEFLLENEFNPNLKNKDGLTPLDIAINDHFRNRSERSFLLITLFAKYNANSYYSYDAIRKQEFTYYVNNINTTFFSNPEPNDTDSHHHKRERGCVIS